MKKQTLFNLILATTLGFYSSVLNANPIGTNFKLKSIEALEEITKNHPCYIFDDFEVSIEDSISSVTHKIHKPRICVINGNQPYSRIDIRNDLGDIIYTLIDDRVTEKQFYFIDERYEPHSSDLQKAGEKAIAMLYAKNSSMGKIYY